jgi:CheY-like chemotaxis protein
MDFSRGIDHGGPNTMSVQQLGNATYSVASVLVIPLHACKGSNGMQPARLESDTGNRCAGVRTLNYSAQPRGTTTDEERWKNWLQPGQHLPLDAVSSPPLARTETILFVEDEAFVRKVTSEVLQGAGYAVFTARNAPEAVQAFQECSGKVDLLLSDIVLPGKNGHAVANEIKQVRPDIRVLLITGYAEQLALGDAGNKRTPCLAKPFSAGVLLRTIRRVLDEREPPEEEADSLKRACGSE